MSTQRRKKTGAFRAVPLGELEDVLTHAGIDVNSPHTASVLAAANAANVTAGSGRAAAAAASFSGPPGDRVIVDTTGDNLLFRVRTLNSSARQSRELRGRPPLWCPLRVWFNVAPRFVKPCNPRSTLPLSAGATRRCRGVSPCRSGLTL